MRPSRLVAIARRDLMMELKGRRGLALPIVMAGLLLPVSSAPLFGGAAPPTGPPQVTVRGDVPAAVLAVDGVSASPEGSLVFTRSEGALVVTGGPLTGAIRDALDQADPAAVAIRQLPRPIPLPGRSMLFALLSASTLTGAVSASIGGERSARTLIALLAAAVSRAEVIVGKWLAWGGLGAFTSLAAAAIAIALGRVQLGWWLLPMVAVPLCAVALSLWLVRRASDVIGGTTVTLRVVPALIGTAGLAAWFVGIDDPMTGAAIPLGGALVAAGATWGNGAEPALLATASTGLTTALLLRSTWVDLDETVGPPAPPSARGLALRTAAIGALVWWTPLLGPMLWGAAGNQPLADSLPVEPGTWAAALGLALISWTTLARQTVPQNDWWRPREPAGLAMAVAAGIALWLALSGPITPLPEAWATAQLRMSAGLHPQALLAGVASALSAEVLFRGWLTDRASEGWALVAWVLVCAPLDPLGGLVSGLLLGAVARKGGLPAACLAHGVWAAAISLG